MKKSNNGASTLLKVGKMITLVGEGNKKGGDNIRVSKSGIFFNPEHAGKIGVEVGSFMLVGLDSGNLYMGKKPSGIFGGYRVSKHKAKNSKRWFISIPSNKLGLPVGEYRLGSAVAQVAEDHTGRKVGYKLFKLEEM